MQTINRSIIAKRIANELRKDIAVLIAQREDKQLERECLVIGRDEFVKKRNWIKVCSYYKAIEKVTNQIEDLNALINPRLSELRRVEEAVII